MPRNWKITPRAVLEALALKAIDEALDLFQARKYELLKALCVCWGALLLMVFTLIVTIRLALA